MDQRRNELAELLLGWSAALDEERVTFEEHCERAGAEPAPTFAAEAAAA